MLDSFRDYCWRVHCWMHDPFLPARWWNLPEALWVSLWNARDFD